MDGLFLFKKIVGPLFLPVPLCIEIMLVGLIFLWLTRKHKTGKVIVSIGFGLFVLLSHSAFTDKLLRPLEYMFPPLQDPSGAQGVKWIVILGGGHVSDPQLPVTSQIDESAAVRLMEGIRLQRMIPGSKLILSGGIAFDPVSEAEIMEDLARAVGLEKQNIVLEAESKDTKDEARIVKEIVGNGRFVLVTSASHMPRSMALFKKEGMNPIPAPTGHWVKEKQGMAPGGFFPGAGSLRKAERAVYEYLGLVWAKIRGEI